MKHNIQRIHVVAEHARRRVLACMGRQRGETPRTADTDETRHET